MDKNIAKLILIVLLLVCVIGFYTYLLSIKAAKPIIISHGDKEKRILSVGTLEDLTNKSSVRHVSFNFARVARGEASCSFEVAFEEPSGTVNGTLVFVLPCDADVYYPENLTIQEKSYAKVVYYPVAMQANTSIKYFFIGFSWPTFSFSTGYGEWWFDIEWKSFSHLLDADFARTGDVFYPLLGGISDDFPVIIHVSLESGYTLKDHHPNAQEDYENEVKWVIVSPWLGSYVTGNYVNNSEKSQFDSLIAFYPFVAGGVTTLLAKEAYKLVKERKKKSMDVDFDY